MLYRTRIDMTGRIEDSTMVSIEVALLMLESRNDLKSLSSSITLPIPILEPTALWNLPARKSVSLVVKKSPSPMFGARETKSCRLKSGSSESCHVRNSEPV